MYCRLCRECGGELCHCQGSGRLQPSCPGSSTGGAGKAACSSPHAMLQALCCSLQPIPAHSHQCNYLQQHNVNFCYVCCICLASALRQHARLTSGPPPCIVWHNTSRYLNLCALQGLPKGRETQAFAQDLLDRLPSTNGASRLSQNQLRERQVCCHPLSSVSFDILTGHQVLSQPARIAQKRAAVPPRDGKTSYAA